MRGMSNSKNNEPDNPTRRSCNRSIWVSQASFCVGSRENVLFLTNWPTIASGWVCRNSAMDAPYQARDDTAVMAASSGGVSIRGMMPRNDLEVKRQFTGGRRKQNYASHYRQLVESPLLLSQPPVFRNGTLDQS